jgi:hypothetical protein
MKSKILIAGLIALGAMSVSAPTMAQNIEIGPNGVRLVQPETEIRRDRDHDRDRDRRPDRREISEREAIRIARGEGLRDVDRVRRTDRAYRISGSDRRGRDIQVVVDRRRGDVISVR